MGMLIDGQWSQKDIALTNDKGEYERVVSSFRDVISATDKQFTPEPDRYHLFANAGCPWAYRALLYRSIKGLEDDISLSLTEPAAGKEVGRLVLSLNLAWCQAYSRCVSGRRLELYRSMHGAGFVG